MTDTAPARRSSLSKLKRRDYAQAWFVGILVVVCALVLYFTQRAANHRVDSGSQQRDKAINDKIAAQQAAAVNAAKAQSGQDLAQRVKDACSHGGVVSTRLGSICPQASAVATAAVPTPVPVAPGVVALPGAQGIPGVSVRGPAGRTVTGPPGKTVVGPPGQNGVDGASVVGPAGVSVTGPPGKDGVDGVSVTGPPGPPGSSGVSVTGPPGVDGNPGQPPFSWTILFRGKTFTCSRADPFDPAAPTYACAA